MNFRKYQDGDESGIVELLNAAWKARYGRWHGLEYWQWKYKGNTAGSPVIWLAENNNKIVGHYSVIPMVMKVGNAYTTGSFSGDAATHPRYQGKGVFSTIVNKCYMDVAQNDIPVTYGFANPELGPIYKRYERMGHICFMTRMIRLMNEKPIPTKHVRKKPPIGLKIETIDRFDQRINGFWNGVSHNFTIIVRRDQEYLNWRYIDNPEKKYTIYTALKDDRILGYCVLTEIRRRDLSLGVIVDILGFQDGCNAVGCLVESALRSFTEHGVDAAVCSFSEKHPYEETFRRAGFIPHPRRRHALYAAINLRGSPIEEKVVYSQALTLSQNPFFKKKRNWFMAFGDGDL